jgi:hypothetical protein
MTVNGGVIDGLAWIYNDKTAAGHVAWELRALGYDVDVIPRRLGTVTVRVTAGATSQWSRRLWPTATGPH